MSEADDSLVRVDSDALKAGGERISLHAVTADNLFRVVEGYSNGYADAGGNGEFGKAFDEKYTPAAKAAVEYLDQLNSVLSGLGVSTVKTGDIFEEVDADTTTTTSGPKRG